MDSEDRNAFLRELKTAKFVALYLRTTPHPASDLLLARQAYPPANVLTEKELAKVYLMKNIAKQQYCKGITRMGLIHLSRILKKTIRIYRKEDQLRELVPTDFEIPYKSGYSSRKAFAANTKNKHFTVK